MRLLGLRARWFCNGQLRRLNFNHHGKHFRIWFEGNNFSAVGFVLGLSKKPGAGYIGGWTAYLALNSGSRQWQMTYAGRKSWCPIEVGVTRNGNRVPHVSH